MGFPKQPSKANLGATLRKLRTAKGLSMGDLARAAGLTVVCVSDLERGRETDITTVPLYLHALGFTSTQKLLYGAAAEMAWKAGQAPGPAK